MADYIDDRFEDIKTEFTIPKSYRLNRENVEKQILRDHSICTVEEVRLWRDNGRNRPLTDLENEEKFLVSILKNPEYTFESNVIEDLIRTRILLNSIKLYEY